MNSSHGDHREEERLDALLRSYRDACEIGEVDPNFMPLLWEKIEKAKGATFSFKRMAKGFVTAAAALSLTLGAVSFLPLHRFSQVTSATYVEELAGYNSSEAADSMDLVHPDLLDDSEDI
jgi:hypothetical protein